MAYVKDVFTASGSGTVAVSYAAIEDDFMFLGYAAQYSGTPATPSGWTALTYNKNGGYGQEIWYRRATASEPTSVSVVGSGFSGSFQLVTCRGVDTTTAFDVTATSRSSANSTIPAAAAITPVTANSLILYFGFDNTDAMVPIPGPIKVGRNNWFSYYTYGAGASVAVAAHDFYMEENKTNNPPLVTIALRDDGNDERKGFVDIASPPAEILHLLGFNGETGHLTGTRSLDLTTQIPTLQGNTTLFKGGRGRGVFEQGFESAGFSTSSTSQALALNGSTTNVTYDLENEIIAFTGQISKSLSQDFATRAAHFVIGDGANFRAWRIDALNTIPSSSDNILLHVLEVDGGFESEEFGTVTAGVLQTIDNYAFGGPGDRSYQDHNIGFLYKLLTMTLVGGSTSLPLDMNTGVEISNTSSLRTISAQNQQSSTQFFCAQKVQVGNGTTATTWVSSQHSLEWPSASSEADRRVQIQIGAGLLGFAIYASASCDIDFSTTTFNMGNFNVWELISGTSTSATYSEVGALIISGDVILRDIGRAIGGMTFTGCKQITQNSADLTGGNTFDACTDTNCIVVTSETLFDNLENCTFTNNNRAIQITGNQSGTWSNDPNLTVSGNTFDIEYTGTTDFSIPSANALTVNNTSSGTLTIVTPVLTLNINSDTASTLIRYFEDDSQTVVDSTTGTTLAYNYPDTDVIDIELVKQSYVPVNRQDVTPFDGDFDVIMDFDEAYNSGHGLTITTEYDYVRATKVLTINSDQAALDVRSSLADVIRTNSSYYNTALLMVAIPGLTRVDLTDGMTITSMATWKGAGMEMFDSADSSNPLEKWYTIKSGGFITGATTHYRQTDSGSSTAVTLTNNVVDEAFQYWDDPNHDGSTADGYDYSGYMVIKAFLAGYKQARSDVIVDAGVSALQSNAYQIVLANTAHGYSGSDPGISADLTLVTGGVVGGKTFAYEIVDGGVNTGADIADQLNYNAANNPNTVIPGGTLLTYFELGNMVIHNASAVETERGYEEGTTPTLVGFYCSRSSADHPGFTRFQADDGTYYVPAVTSNISITGMPAAGNEIRLQIHNETAKSASAWASTTVYTEGDKVLRSTGVGTEQTAGLYMVCTTGGTSGGSEPTWDTTVGNTTADNTVTWTTYAILYYDDDPLGTGYADSYTDGEEFASGDTYRIRFAELNTTTSFKIFETTAIVSSTGFSVAVNEDADAVYALNGVDGSSATVTNKFSPDYSNNEIDLDTNSDFAVTEAFAYYCYELTTSEGMYTAWGGVTAIDTGNYRNNTSVFSLYFDETAGFVKQTDSARWFRSDDTRPARDPTTGGNGIEINWRNPVYAYDGGGGGFTSGDRATLDAAATEASLTTVDTNVDSILEDTGTTLPAQITALNDIAATDIVSGGAITTSAGAVSNVTTVATTTTNTDMRGTDGASTFNPSADTLEGSETYDEALRLMRAEAAGAIADDGVSSANIKSADGLKDRIEATYDSSGSRTITSTDGT